MELTEPINDYVATKLLSKIKLDFFKGEIFETTQHFPEIIKVFIAPNKIYEKLNFDQTSCLKLCSLEVLDSLIPRISKQKMIDDFKKLIN